MENIKNSLKPGLNGTPHMRVTAENLYMFINAQKNALKPTKIEFVDCQDEENNAGKAFLKAIYLHLPHNVTPEVVTTTFDTAIAKSEEASKRLAEAQVVVYYCQVGSSRSPFSYLAHNAHFKSLKDKQLVVVLHGGITRYSNLYGGTLTPWNKPENGRSMMDGMSKSKPTLKKQGTHPGDLGTLYTDP